jgi:hypothetical protein
MSARVSKLTSGFTWAAAGPDAADVGFGKPWGFADATGVLRTALAILDGLQGTLLLFEDVSSALRAVG